MRAVRCSAVRGSDHMDYSTAGEVQQAGARMLRLRMDRWGVPVCGATLHGMHVDEAHGVWALLETMRIKAP